MAASSDSTHSFIGVDLSGSTVMAALISNSGAVIEREEVPFDSARLVETVAAVGKQMLTRDPTIEALGVAVPGLVNRQSNRVISSREFPAAADLHEQLTLTVGVRVKIENDANAAAYGEFKVGAGRGSQDMFYITIGDGIGGALIMDGKLWTGSSGFAGEVGHITIDTEGLRCECGNTGCLETVASAPNIVRRAKARLKRDSTSSLSRLAINKRFTASDLAHEAKNGDDFSIMMLERTGKFIGTAVASVINLLNIEKIVLGGGVMEAGELILDPIIREAKHRAFQPCFEATSIVGASLGPDAVAIGVALLARDSA